jgi:acetyl esterase/lipase
LRPSSDPTIYRVAMGHPGVEIISEYLAETGLMAGTIPEQRAAMEAMAADAPPPPGVSVQPVMLAGRDGERIVPDGRSPSSVVLYLHGGGYCIGSLASHRGLASRIALASGCAVVTLDYRLGPEHHFPDAVDDATAAYRELLADGADPGSVAIAGDSAGGGLTMATLLALRRAGDPLPAAAVCLSPWADLTQSSDSYQRLADVDPMITKAGLDDMADAYLGGADPRDELASPLWAEDLSGLPPVMIEVGANELLLDDATELARRIEADGGTATLTVWPDLIHVFQAFPGPLIPEADESIAAVGSFLAAQL